MAPEQSEGATKGLRVINSVDPSVLKPNFLDYTLIIVPLQLPLKCRQLENITTINSNITW